MSWFTIVRPGRSDAAIGVGTNGYVKRFGSVVLLPDGSAFVSGRRVSRIYVFKRLHREVCRANQCSYADGPQMPPDFVHGQDISSWLAPDHAQEYNSHLLYSTLAQVGGRHFVLQSWHKAIPKNCLVIDSSVNPNVDLVVNAAPLGKYACR